MLPAQRLYLAAAAGFLSHVVFFVNGEHHIRPLKLVLLFSIGTFGLLIIQLSQSNGVVSAVGDTLLEISSYGFTLFASIIVYRLFFHRLRRFPGPTLARVSKLWHVIKLSQKPNFRLLDELHDKYGDFVRIGEHTRRCRG